MKFEGAECISTQAHLLVSRDQLGGCYELVASREKPWHKYVFK